MSLLSNRGRFSRPEKQNDFKKSSNESSSLSSRGTNPRSLFNIDQKAKTENGKRFKDNLSSKSFDDNFIDNKFVTKHYLYEENKRNVTKKKSKKGLIALMIVIEVFAIFGIAALGTFIRVSNMTQKVSFDKANVQNNNIDESTLAVMKGYKTVAIFGVDSRTGSVDKGNNSDVNIIANLNLETGDVQLVSVYRDLYLSVTDNNTYDKLNSAYRKGGPESAVKALNKNLDLNIQNFFSFNWKAVADGIELLGGIDIEITKAEYRYMNAFIHETCIATGIDSKNPAAHYIKGPGTQHLDGVQSVAYGRLRLMDSDFQRVERQKKVIALCLQKAKTLDLPKLRLIMDAVLPQIAYEFDMNEMLSIIKIINKINIVESCGVPEINNVSTMDMGSAGDCVVPLNLEKAVIKLHEVLFNKSDYQTSQAVKRYSNRISELRVKYQEENRIKASIKASEEEASRLEELKPKTKRSTKSTANRKRSSSSTTDRNNNDVVTDPNNDIDNDEDVVPIMDYEDEPEEDEIVETEDKIIDNDESENKVFVGEGPGSIRSTVNNDENLSDHQSESGYGPVSTAKPVSAPGEDNAPVSVESPGGPVASPINNQTDQGVVISGPPGS